MTARSTLRSVAQRRQEECVKASDDKRLNSRKPRPRIANRRYDRRMLEIRRDRDGSLRRYFLMNCPAGKTDNKMLEISNLHATVADKPILNGVSLYRPGGRSARDHGPERIGQVDARLCARRASRLARVVLRAAMSRSRVSDSLLAMEPHERAAAGLFLGFQYPVEIPGVSYLQFLRESLNTQRRARGESELSGAEFIKLARSQAALLGMDAEMLKRPVNVGFSGGEKKRAEMVQMGIMNPKFAILDETDSGLDIDALQRGRRRHQPHHARARQGRASDHPLPAAARLCDARQGARPSAGRSYVSGGPELAHELEREGYAEAAA